MAFIDPQMILQMIQQRQEPGAPGGPAGPVGVPPQGVPGNIPPPPQNVPQPVPPSLGMPSFQEPVPSPMAPPLSQPSMLPDTTGGGQSGFTGALPFGEGNMNFRQILQTVLPQIIQGLQQNNEQGGVGSMQLLPPMRNQIAQQLVQQQVATRGIPGGRGLFG